VEIGPPQCRVAGEQLFYVPKLGEVIGHQLVEKEQVGFQLQGLRPPLAVGGTARAGIAQPEQGREMVLE